MTTIAKIETLCFRSLDKNFFYSQWDYSERNICIVKITCDDGTYGWGEGYGPAKIVEAGINFFKNILIGENPIHNELIWSKMYRKSLDFARRGVLVASISAIDIAIWDIKGKLLNMSVGELMGGVHRNKITHMQLNVFYKNNPTKDYKYEAEKYMNKVQGNKNESWIRHKRRY